MNPKGKTAIVTGGAHRIGKAITLGLADAGVNVVVNYNTSAVPAAQTVREVHSLGVDAIAVQADVADSSQVKTMVTAVVERFGSVDILVNSASQFRKTPLPTDDQKDWHTTVDILIHGAFHCANAVAPLMLQQRMGVIVNIVDMMAWQPRPIRSPLCRKGCPLGAHSPACGRPCADCTGKRSGARTSVAS